MKAAIYARYSTEHQNENSIETQVAECTKYAQERGMVITGIYTDEAKSGMKMQRSGLLEMLTDIENKNFDAVLIYDQSRLSRDVVDWFTLRKSLEVYHIDLYSVANREKFGDMLDPTNFMVEGVQAIFNQLHVLTTRKKVIDGMRNIALKGGFTGGTPCLGYKVVNKRLEIDEEEAETVRLIFSMCASGHSYVEIMNELNLLGKKTKAGQPFGKNSLNAILNNEKYIGNLIYGRVKKEANGKRNTHKSSEDLIRVEGAVPAIISKEVWEDVKKVMVTRKKRTAYNAIQPYLLTGKIFCGECGNKMTGERRNKYSYYACYGNRRLHNCTKTAVNKDKIESQVMSQIHSFFLENDFDLICKNLSSSLEQINSSIPNLKKAVIKQIDDTTNKIQNINNAIADGIYSKSTVENLKRLEQLRSDLYLELANLENDNLKTKHTEEEIKEAIKYALESPDNCQGLIDLCVEKIKCYNNGDVVVTLFGALEDMGKSGAAEQT